jgi:hypothetical protein
MLRFYLRLALIPVALFTAALLVIHAQSYDDHELRELLLPEGCPAPCFMGIHPGVTTVDEAMELLKKSGWVEIESPDLISERDTSQLRLPFNDNQPAVIYADQPLILIFQNAKPNVIMQIFIDLQNTVTLGDLYLILGKPSRFNREIFLTPDMGYDRYYLTVSHIYDSKNIDLGTVMICPITLSRLLNHARISVGYTATVRANRPLDFKTILNYPQCG